ncbi:MAG: CBS domain-containing protein [Cellvibrionaceae bacterium]
MSSSILVKDYMDYDPHAIPVSYDVRNVVQALLKAKVHGAPVIDENRKLVGFVSEQDCIKDLLNDIFYCEEPATVSSVMRKDVITVTADTSIVQLAENMSDKRPKNYPVVDEQGMLIGLINRSQVLKALLENADDCYIKKAN